MLKTAQEVIASGDDRAIVDYAIEVSRLINRHTAELETAKAHLRGLAQKTREGKPLVELEGNLGVAEVRFPLRSDVKARKGRDLRDLEVNLEKSFSRLFLRVVQIQPVEDFADEAQLLSPEERAVLDRFVEVTPATPKVFLTK